jgi:hypothetical protein
MAQIKPCRSQQFPYPVPLASERVLRGRIGRHRCTSVYWCTSASLTLARRSPQVSGSSTQRRKSAWRSRCNRQTRLPSPLPRHRTGLASAQGR